RAGVTLTGPQSNDGQVNQALKLRLERALSQPNSPFEKAVFLDYRSTSAIRDYASLEQLEEIAQRGTVTPDHVIRIKPWPMIIEADADDAAINKALAGYASRYTSYFERNAARQSEPKQMLDVYPRVIIVRHNGMYALGSTEKAAKIGGDLCEQATRAIIAAEAYGRFTPIGEADLFDMEYWSLEQAKLKVAAH
ncbi:MAG: class II aldolase, partial [Alphaproteobacteria bacterium]|nr:class II aldolase [Alphaproteobacteria bacterium]